MVHVEFRDENRDRGTNKLGGKRAGLIVRNRHRGGCSEWETQAGCIARDEYQILGKSMGETKN